MKEPQHQHHQNRVRDNRQQEIFRTDLILPISAAEQSRHGFINGLFLGELDHFLLQGGTCRSWRTRRNWLFGIERRHVILPLIISINGFAAEVCDEKHYSKGTPDNGLSNYV